MNTEGRMCGFERTAREVLEMAFGAAVVMVENLCQIGRFGRAREDGTKFSKA
jgi:hypothetical protein